MWEKILAALLHELENNPGRILEIIEEIITLLKGNPDAVKALTALIVSKTSKS